VPESWAESVKEHEATLRKLADSDLPLSEEAKQLLEEAETV